MDQALPPRYRTLPRPPSFPQPQRRRGVRKSRSQSRPRNLSSNLGGGGRGAGIGRRDHSGVLGRKVLRRSQTTGDMDAPELEPERGQGRATGYGDQRCVCVCVFVATMRLVLAGSQAVYAAWSSSLVVCFARGSRALVVGVRIVFFFFVTLVGGRLIGWIAFLFFTPMIVDDDRGALVFVATLDRGAMVLLPARWGVIALETVIYV